jgi:syntaxin 1B/2/3
MQEHEMQNYPEQSAVQTLSQQEFLGRIDFLRNEIGTLTNNVQAIASMHQRSLAEADSGLSAQQLERVVAETQSLNSGIRDQLKFLANDANRTTDGSRSVKERQVATIKNQFERELHSYQEEESNFRSRYRDQIARQYRIVNPQATEDEVRQATEADWGNEGVFQTAVCFSIVFPRISDLFVMLTSITYSSAPLGPAKHLQSSALFAPVTTSCSASSRRSWSSPIYSRTWLS